MSGDLDISDEYSDNSDYSDKGYIPGTDGDSSDSSHSKELNNINAMGHKVARIASQLVGFLGHDIQIHREFYRLPESTLELAKVSKILIAMEKGRLPELQGKGLDNHNNHNNHNHKPTR